MSYIDRISAWMKAQVGEAECPKGSNSIIYNSQYYGREVSGDAYPWCVTFLWAGFNACDMSKIFLCGEKTASVAYITDWAKRHGHWITDGYREGDILCYGTAHAGYCIQGGGSYVTAIEGNCSDKVSRVDRRAEEITGAYRPDYGIPEDVPQKKPEEKPIKHIESSTGGMPPLPDEDFHAGDIIHMAEGAVYWDGEPVPDWVLRRDWIIKSVFGERAVIDKSADGAYSIMSAVSIRYCRIVRTAAEAAAERAGVTEYKVRSGDTLWGIARRFLGSGARYKEIMKANGLDKTTIFPGQTLKIPGRK